MRLIRKKKDTTHIVNKCRKPKRTRGYQLHSRYFKNILENWKWTEVCEFALKRLYWEMRTNFPFRPGKEVALSSKEITWREKMRSRTGTKSLLGI